MGLNESANSYWGRRMSNNLLRMDNQHIHDKFLRNVFIGRLYSFEFNIYVRERAATTIEDAFAVAKTWEESRMEGWYIYLIVIILIILILINMTILSYMVKH